ncbi:hypothetical protein TRVA0_037S00914 [Trichomonascus vanleenenianus]|uniref:uncharacterized protein n=1 Tax=Trichomonascus vanleenenianus TaxID=2268995 RepID=UPI003ECAC0D0
MPNDASNGSHNASSITVPPVVPPAVHTAPQPAVRRSTRVRTSTTFYEPQPIPLRSSGKSKKSKPDKKKGEKADDTPKKRPTAPEKKDTPSKKPKKQEPVVLPPEFNLVPCIYPEDILLKRLVIREFFIRFEPLCRLPVRHSSAINDPTGEWSNYLYKSVITSCLKIVLNDSFPLISQPKARLQEFERTNADSRKLWVGLREYLVEAEVERQQRDAAAAAAALPASKREESQSVEPELPPPDIPQLALQKYGEIPEDDEIATERYRVQVITDLVHLATTTETIRIELQEDFERTRQVNQQMQNEVKNLKTAWETLAKKMMDNKPADGEPLKRWRDKFAAARVSSQSKILQTEAQYYYQLRKLNSRAASIGVDTLGNEYWLLQQKAKDMKSWGSWIFVIKASKLTHPSGEYVKDEKMDEVLDPAGHQNQNKSIYYISDKQQMRQLATWIKHHQVKQLHKIELMEKKRISDLKKEAKKKEAGKKEMANGTENGPEPSVNGKPEGDDSEAGEASSLEMMQLPNLSKNPSPLVKEILRFVEYVNEENDIRL